MAALKEQVLEMIKKLPDDATVDDIMAELYFRLQVDTGLAELDEGKGIPHNEVEKKSLNGSRNKMVTRICCSP